MEAGVFYTDGGKRPLGVGWGLHGYTYSIDGSVIKAPRNQNQPTDFGYMDKIMKAIKHDRHGKEVVVEQTNTFSDGPVSETADLKKATQPLKKEYFTFKDHKAVPIKPTKYIDAWGGLDKELSNNSAELKALTYALDYAEEKGLKKIKILSDSEYSVLGTVNALKWKSQGWKNSRGLPCSNKDLWVKTLKSIADAANAGREVQFVWVRAHNGEKGNELADRSATKGLILNTIPDVGDLVHQEEDAKTYGKNTYQYPRLLAFPVWYFRTNTSHQIQRENGEFQYYVGTHSKHPEMAGKRAIDHNFGVVRLKERVPAYDQVMEAQERILNSSEETIVFGLNTTIFKDEVLLEFDKNGSKYFYPKEESFNRDVVLFDKMENGGVQLTHVAKPPRIADRVFQYCDLLDYVLDQYLKEDESITVTDLTDVFQKKTEDKKGKVKYELHDAVKSPLTVMKIEANHSLGGTGKKQFHIGVGFTVPSKNNLAKLIGPDFTIKLLTWKECDIAFRYAAVVTSKDGIAIYATHSNSVICK